jgi:hypothetical protein
MPVDDLDIITRIDRLVDEEHRLRSHTGEGGLPADDELRLQRVEEALDQCWDLLRQRRARRHAGEDPDQAGPRDIPTVEGYEQ